MPERQRMSRLPKFDAVDLKKCPICGSTTFEVVRRLDVGEDVAKGAVRGQQAILECNEGHRWTGESPS